MKKNRLVVVLVLFVVLFVFCCGYYYYKDTESIDAIQSHVTEDTISVSVDSGFYDETIYVSLSKNYEFPAASKIYYTLDGNDPTTEDMEYTSAIELMLNDDMTVYPLKAVIYHNGGYSNIVERTYILSSDVSNEYNLDIISITSDEYNLYDYDYGILVPGRIYDENKATGAFGYIKGNYSIRDDEWIRDAHVSMFDADGRKTFEQNVGLCVAGSTSSEYAVKSLKICADIMYDENYDKLNLSLINEGVTFSSYSFVDEYSSIRIRAGSQDQNYGNIRSSIVSRLAQMSNFDGCTATNRCIVYLNGEFYGLFDMQQNYSNSYLANRFGIEESEYISKCKAGETTALSINELDQYFAADLDDESNRELLEKHVDMDNYLLYYAINILCNNTDWPGNNYEMWRYTGEYDQDNEYTDGRYRFLIFDTDLSFNTDETPLYFEGCRDDIFESLMQCTYRGSGSLFSNVMKSEYYRDKFLTILCDLLNTSFSRENVLEVIKSENQKIKSVRSDFYDEEFAKRSELCVMGIIKVAISRPGQVKNVIKTHFGLQNTYKLELRVAEGVTVHWNNMKVFANEEYDCNYYECVKFILNQKAYPGYEFKYWLVNGEKVYDDELVIADSLISDGKICIEAVAETQGTDILLISKVFSKGEYDWIEITNAGQSDMNIHDYYISDDDKLLLKYQLPDIILNAGESVVIYGSKNYNSIGDYICNFSLNSYETLYLSKNSELCDKVAIPKMSSSETYGRYDNSNVWVYYSSLTTDGS